MVINSYLKPIYDSHESFYNKARVTIETDCNQNGERFEKYTLFSYETRMCAVTRTYKKNGAVHIHLDKFSSVITATTMRHIREFWRQYVNSGEFLDLGIWRTIACC